MSHGPPVTLRPGRAVTPDLNTRAACNAVTGVTPCMCVKDNGGNGPLYIYVSVRYTVTPLQAAFELAAGVTGPRYSTRPAVTA